MLYYIILNRELCFNSNINEIIKMTAQHLTWWETNLKSKEWYEKFIQWNKNSPYKQIIREYIVRKNYRSLLDCGSGLCTEFFEFRKLKYDLEYYAIDITPIVVQEGKKKGIRIEQGSIDSLPYPDNFVDVCICFDCLNHQKDFEQQINEMLRVAKKELIISFFKSFSDDSSDTINEGWHENKECTLIYNHFSKSRLEKFLNKKEVQYNLKIEKGSKRSLLFIKKLNMLKGL